jgi:predicted GNAT family N-acyltransferase
VGFQVEKEKNVENTYRLSFLLNEIVSTIRIVLDYDRNEIVITNMTVLPSEKTRFGYGRKAISALLEWSKTNNFKKIVATQVQDDSEGFWEKIGFKKSSENIELNDFEYKL